jgi:hypothetical protein
MRSVVIRARSSDLSDEMHNQLRWWRSEPACEGLLFGTTATGGSDITLSERAALPHTQDLPMLSAIGLDVRPAGAPTPSWASERSTEELGQ